MTTAKTQQSYSTEAENVLIPRRVWQRTCEALEEAEAENVALRKRLRLWADLHDKNGWVDAEVVEEAMNQEASDDE